MLVPDTLIAADDTGAAYQDVIAEIEEPLIIEDNGVEDAVPEDIPEPEEEIEAPSVEQDGSLEGEWMEVPAEEGTEMAGGTFDLLFTMETRQLANVTVVAFEKLLHRNLETGEDVEVDRHEELDDEDQNVYELDMCTTATDVSTKSHTGNTTGTIIDAEVVLKNLVRGYHYRLDGMLVDRATGSPLLVGREANDGHG